MVTTTIPGQGLSYVSSKTNTGPDPAVVQDQLLWLQNTLKVLGQEDFCKFFFWILVKKEEGKDQIPLPKGFWNRRLIPFVPNAVQVDMINREKKRNLCVKYRQGGYTTDKIARKLYIPAITEPGAGCLLISQNHFYAAQHFAILKRLHRYFGTPNPYDFEACGITRWFHNNLLHTVASNRRELVFDQLDSKILIDSAEQEEAGQGLTLSHLVCTEVARWPGNPEETLANLKESLPDDGTVDIESTANGIGGYFYQEALRASGRSDVKSEFNYFFHEWWWHKEYTADRVGKKRYRMSDIEIDYEKDPLTDDEKMVKEKAHLTLGQIGFRRVKKLSLRHNFDEKYPEDDLTCLAGDSVVILADGTKVCISTLVSQRYSGKVLTVGSDGRITTGRVVGWHRSKRAGRRLFRLTYDHGKNAHGVPVGATLTEEHQVMVRDGWCRADECNGFEVATGTPAPGPRAFQLLIGTILGDSTLIRRGLSCTQIVREYIELKASLLKLFGAKWYEHKSAPKGYGTSRRFGVYTKPFPYLAWLRERFYKNGVKTVPFDLISQINDFGIAVWFMDDGWKKTPKGGRPSGGIHLGLLPKEVGDRLANLLTDRGYECICRPICEGSYHIIAFTCDGFESLSEVIGRYVPSCMRYKLLSDAPKFEPCWFNPESPKMFWDRAACVEVQPRLQSNGRKSERGPFYCLDVEDTHNFVTMGGVVHNCFLVSGHSFFDKDILRFRLLELEHYEPIVTKRGGEVEIYNKRIRGRRYIIGADTAQGRQVSTEDTDYSAAVVIDEETGEEMASLCARIPPEDFADDLVELAEQYNYAMIAVERGTGGDGGVVLYRLTEMQYWNIYKHKDVFRARAVGMQQRKDTEVPGMPMVNKIRIVALNRLRQFVEHYPDLIYDKKFLEEAMMFARNEMGKPVGGGEEENVHDDRVLARGIAYLCRLVALNQIDLKMIKNEHYGDDPDAKDNEAPGEAQ